MNAKYIDSRRSTYYCIAIKNIAQKQKRKTMYG